MPLDDRPLPDPGKLLGHFADWQRGDVLPGRTLAHLKTGRLPELLAEVGTPAAESLLATWSVWERGKADPGALIRELEAGGLAELLAGLAGTG